jgi:putative PIN family toxin of toxin-antitoxin system
VRLVLDTNTVLSGLLWHGTPGKLIDAAQAKTITLVTSIPLLAELRSVLERDKFAKQLTIRGVGVDDLFNGYAALAEIVVPATMVAAVPRDPDDDRVLATALAGEADFVVSGDAHLLNLKHYQGIPIVRPADALLRIEQGHW